METEGLSYGSDQWAGSYLKTKLVENWRYLVDQDEWIHWEKEALLWQRGHARGLRSEACDHLREHFDERIAAFREGDPELKEARKLRASFHSNKRLSEAIRAAEDQGGEGPEQLWLRSEDLDYGRHWVLFKNGLLDLRPGETAGFFETDPDIVRGAYFTQQMGTSYDPAARCPRWEQFLQEILEGDLEMVQFLQRAFGLCLSGETLKQVFCVLGPTDTGKSVLMDTLLRIFGTYGHVAGTALYKRNPGNEGLWEKARLRGKRLVVASEFETGSVLDEGLLKQLTGNEQVTARETYGKAFSFEPQAKYFLESNFKPRVQDQESAIWRRMLVIPLEHRLPPEAQDPELRAKLWAEAPGIAAWLVAGWWAAKEKGLEPPAKVTEARDEYQQAQDFLAPFLQERCQVYPNASTTNELLYPAYRTHAIENGEKVLSLRALGDALVERGFRRYKYNNVRGFRGLTVRLYAPAEGGTDVRDTDS